MNFAEENILLAPMHVDALVIGKSPRGELFQWSDLAPDFSKLEEDFFPFGPELVADGDPLTQAERLPAGIHLHFRVPAGLRHGEMAPGGGLDFPCLPNRWLVQRIIEAPDGSISGYRAFLLMSDAETPVDQTGLAWPVWVGEDGQLESGFTRTPGGKIRLIRIGRREDVADVVPEAEGPTRLKITAIGQGDPMFAAQYRASGRILGFHDTPKDLADAGAGSGISYLVTGWYSSALADPLFEALTAVLWQQRCLPGQEVSEDGEIPSWHDLPDNRKAALRGVLADLAPISRDDLWRNLSDTKRRSAATMLEEWMKERQWAGTAGDPLVGNPPPWRLLCHGLVRKVQWRGAGTNYQQPTDDEGFAPGIASAAAEVFPIDPRSDEGHRVALGEAPGEALAALLAPGAIAQDLLTALQEGILDQPVTVETLKSELHGRRFDAVEGGAAFAAYAELGTDTGEARATTFPRVPPALQDEVACLNADQAEVDDLARRLADIRRQFHGLWKLAISQCEESGSCYESLEDIPVYGGQIEAISRVFRTLMGDYEDAVVRRDARLPDGDPDCPAGTLASALSAAGLEFRLTRSSADPFHRSSDPIIAVAGVAARVAHAAPRLKESRCRSRDEVTSALEVLTATARRGSLERDTLLGQVPDLPEKLDMLHRALLAEALFLDDAPERRNWLAKLLAGQMELQTDATSLAEDIAVWQENAPDTTSFVFTWTGSPWIPQALVWEVVWTPSFSTSGLFSTFEGLSISPDLIKARWHLDGDEDLSLRPKADGAGHKKTTFKGYIPLSTTGYRKLSDKMRQIIQDYTPQRASNLVAAFEDRWACYQRLAGFDSALKMRRAALELPAFDYAKWYETGELVTAEFPEEFRRNGQGLGPAPVWRGDGPFLPIRDGTLSIIRLSIVDIFGQTRKIIDETGKPPLERVEFRTARGTVKDDQHRFSARLQPRLAQPARLRFEPEDFELEDGRHFGPVAGWVAMNWLEQSLLVHRADGRPLFILQKRLGTTAAQKGFQVLPVPEELSAPRPEEIEDPDLRLFRTWAGELSVQDAQSFFDAVGRVVESADERIPENEPGVSLLVGRPFALVRAALWLELLGMPACRPTLRADEGGYVTETHDFERVKWPVRLGGERLRNDGLVGFFKRAPTGKTPFCFAAGGSNVESDQNQDLGKDQDQDKDKAFAPQDLQVDAMTPLRVLMLMDPQARVHATSGMLPRKHLELPEEIAGGAGRIRESFFQTAPVLGFSPDSAPAMPIPSDDFGEWSWVWRPDVQTTATDPDLVRAAERGGFTGTWPMLSEGWLKLRMTALRGVSLWMREPAASVMPGSLVTLEWSAHGAESVVLEKKAADESDWHLLCEQQPPEPAAGQDAPISPGLSGNQRELIEATTTFRIIARSGEETVTRELSVAVAGDESENGNV